MKSTDTNIIYINPQGVRSESSLRDLQSSVRLLPKDAATFDAPDKPTLFALLHKAVETGVTPVLFDPKMQIIAERVSALGISRFDVEKGTSGLPKDAYALFFTSGTTGIPTGAIKSEQNIQSELDALKTLFKDEAFERVIVTVPFIHIYGFLAGVMLPTYLGCEVLFKEEYWPQDLLKLHEGKKTLIVTTPVYIKSLLRLKRAQDLNNVLFLSSTGLLLEEEVKQFQEKYNSRIFQLFGSTETGGIAIKKGISHLWTPLNGVNISQNSEGVMVVDSPYLSTHLLEEKIRILPHSHTTTDIIELEGDGFVLMGRLNEILKISGKRISILELETLLEKQLKIKEALIRIVRNSARLKDESLVIALVSKIQIEKGDVSALFKEFYPEITIDFELESVEKISKNSIGKKVRK